MPSSIDPFAETLASCVTIDDFEEAARARLPPMAYDDYRCGADEDSPRPRGRTSPPPPRSDLAVLAETCAPRPLVVKGLVRGDDARAALGLGARAVFVGRPVLWGLGAAGEAGVARVLAGGSGPPLAPAALIAAIVAAAATIRSSEVGYSTATPRRIFASVAVRYAKQATAGAPDLEKTTMQTTSSTEGTTRLAPQPGPSTARTRTRRSACAISRSRTCVASSRRSAAR